MRGLGGSHWPSLAQSTPFDWPKNEGLRWPKHLKTTVISNDQRISLFSTPNQYPSREEPSSPVEHKPSFRGTGGKMVALSEILEF